MTSNRFGPRFAPLRYDPSRAFVPFTAISRTESISLNDRTEAIRRELLTDCGSQCEGKSAFVDRPEQMLAGYRRSRSSSELGRILAAGKRIRDSVDRVVIIGGQNGRSAAGALFEAGCHPYHNELSRGDRGGRPRIYFAANEPDNDALQGLRDLLCSAHRPATVDHRWAAIVIDETGDSPASLAALRCLLAALCNFGSGGRESERPSADVSKTIGRSVVAVSAAESPIARSAQAFGPLETFDRGTGEPLPVCLFTAVGLLPAAVMGLDVVQLLKGAAAMNERFRTSPPGDNPALDYAALAHVVAMQNEHAVPRVVPWTKALEPTAQWCQRVRSQCDRQPCESRSRGLQTNLIVDTPRRDRLVVMQLPEEIEGRADLPAPMSFADLQAAALQRDRETLASHRLPSADLVLPSFDESSLGQLFQMMLLAAAVESRL